MSSDTDEPQEVRKGEVNDENDEEELVYDPDQDRGERIAIRKEYRQLHDDGMSLH